MIGQIVVIPYIYRYSGDFSSGVATVLKQGKQGAINHNDDTIINYQLLLSVSR